MDLILWRHAQAETAELDLGRTLTPYGRKQAARMGAWLDRTLPESCRVLSSPAARCVQTAEALGRKYKILPELGVMAKTDEVLQAAGWPDSRSPVLVVGHQPWLGQLAALLLCGEKQDLTVKKANAWWLASRERDGEIEIYLRAVLAPEFFIE